MANPMQQIQGACSFQDTLLPFVAETTMVWYSVDVPKGDSQMQKLKVPH